jgi:ubiquinone/menaquinone biosynthesis C-methylase UbiE
LRPPLNLEDNSVDILYCVSVFTHLSEELHFEWINEIMRVLKPGGVFIGTFHGDKTKHKLFSDELVKYEQGELVVRGNVYEGSKNFVAIHSDLFVRNKLLKEFTSVSQIQWPGFHQELYCAVKPVSR